MVQEVYLSAPFEFSGGDIQRMRKWQHPLPPIGARILKSSIAVLLCMAAYYIRTLLPIGNGIPFYSALAALWCMQPYTETTRKMAEQRSIGTMTGAAFGLLLLLILPAFSVQSQIFVYCVASVCIIPVIYTTVLINRRNAAFFSCVVFLSIALTHSFDDNPYLFVLNRILDTFIGIGIGIAVNQFHLPLKHDNQTLYISGIDSVLLSDQPYGIPYSKVELNRLISEGVKFTVSTIHTPAELIPILSGVNLRIPLVVMNGAALYDMKRNLYIDAEPLSETAAKQAEAIIAEQRLQCFVSILFDHTLLVFYDNLQNEAEKAHFDKQKLSPYCNYVHASFRTALQTEKILYLTVIAETHAVHHLEQRLLSEMPDIVRVCVFPSEMQRFAILNVCSPLASKKHMTEKLKILTKSENAVTFGSIEGEYDVTIRDGGGNHTIKMLRHLYHNGNH